MPERTRRELLSFTIFLVVILSLFGCKVADPRESPGTIRVGLLPHLSEEELRQQTRPLVAHLEAQTGLDLEIAVVASYDDLLNQFHEGQIHLAFFGGLTFVRAEQRSGARALVMRDVDLDFTTDFLVSSSRQEGSLKELAGSTVMFGPFLSTSGHLMPRYHLQRMGIDPETFFADVRHSNGHDETALSILDGHADIGAVNSVVVERMFRDGRLSRDNIRVLQTTAPYRNYVWAVRPDLADSTRIALRDAFLSLRSDVPEDEAILSAHGTRGFVPVDHDDYDELRQAAEMLRLMGDDDS